MASITGATESAAVEAGMSRYSAPLITRCPSLARICTGVESALLLVSISHSHPEREVRVVAIASEPERLSDIRSRRLAMMVSVVSDPAAWVRVRYTFASTPVG